MAKLFERSSTDDSHSIRREDLFNVNVENIKRITRTGVDAVCLLDLVFEFGKWTFDNYSINIEQ